MVSFSQADKKCKRIIIVNIAASSEGGPKPMQMASEKRCPAGTCIYRFTHCHGNSILDINIPFTVSHRPCFDIILMKFEANWVKVT